MIYETDFVAWTRQQASVLRTMPGTEGLDIDHLVDEIEGLGRSAVADLSSAIRQVLTSLIQRSIDPSAISLEDIYSAQSDAIICADAGVWRHVDLDKTWRLSKRSVEPELPDRCPLSIAQLISEDFDIAAAIKAIKS